jgi:hypothetical protein
MIDRRIESDIKAVKGFLEFWGKFHSLYDDIISKERISREDEEVFLNTKTNIREKYEALKSGLEFKYMPKTRITDPVGDVLALEGVHFISEKNLKRMEDDWRDSYVFLNNILERFENKKRRLDRFNPLGVFLKKIFDRRSD